MQLYHHQPKTGLEGKFSIEYCMAVARLDRDVKLAQFDDERVNRGDVQELLRKVKYVQPEGADWTGGIRLAQAVTVRHYEGTHPSQTSKLSALLKPERVPCDLIHLHWKAPVRNGCILCHQELTKAG